MNVDVDRYPVQKAVGVSRMSDEIGSILLHAACVGDVAAIHNAMSGGNGYCDVDQADKNGRCAIHWAVVKGHENVVETLVTSYHANIDLLTREHSESPLMLAVKSGNANLVQMLLNYGAQTQTTNCDGESALHLAAASGNAEICDLLVQHGAWLELEDAEGESPLFFAVRENSLPVVSLLLSAGASPSHPNNDNDTPLTLARECHSTNRNDQAASQILEILLQAEQQFSQSSSATFGNVSHFNRHNLLEPFTRVESKSFGSSSGNLCGFLTKTI